MVKDATALALQTMGGAFEWGRADCCTAACDVFRDLHGLDPMQPLRGQYSSAVGAYRLIRARGGWLRMADDMARGAGLLPADGWAEGRLGLCPVGRDYALVVGIEHGLWAGKGKDGMVAVRDVVAAWQR